MPHDDFESELIELVEQARQAGMPYGELEPMIAGLHRKYGRKIPPPITGTLTIIEPEDSLR